MQHRFALYVPLATLLLIAPAPAQTGPWTDGELVVRSVLPSSQTQAIYRIAPETGHGVELVSGFYWGGWAGSMVFDPYRDALLTSMSLPPDPYWREELWVVSHDGSTVVIPGFTDVPLRALAPIGDGRVYFQRHQGNPNWEVEYLDASNQVHTLMDDTGAVPFSFSVEHMLYHAPTNSLIATNSGWWSPNDCVTGLSSVFRIPLSPDGSQVAGPVTCASVAGVSNNIMSMDYLPGGDILLNMAGSQYFDDTLRRLDPLTLATTIWAQPGPPDLNGAVWSARIGRAVVLDDGANVLRAYLPGQAGGGTVISADVPVSPGTSGYSPAETMTRVDLNGPGCVGTSHAFGTGVAGKGGFVPSLGAVGCPDIGKPFSLSIDDVVGGGVGALAVGFTAGAVPIAGGTLYVVPISSQLPVVAGGDPDAAGAGSYSMPLLFPDPAFAGFTVYLQAGFFDAGAVQGISLSNGLLLSIG
jgi:hypothetical protein